MNERGLEVSVDEAGAVRASQPWSIALAGRRCGLRVEVRLAPIDGFDDELRAAVAGRQLEDPFTMGELQGALDIALHNACEAARARFVRTHVVPRVVPA